MRSKLKGLLVATIAAVALSPVTPVSATETPEIDYAAAAVGATNAARAEFGLGRLRGNACLKRFATAHAKRMASEERLFHQSLRPISRACGLSRVGENVAAGYPTGSAAVVGWMGSSGHRANILSRSYRLVAVAAAQSGSTWYVAQVFGRKR